MRHMVLLAVLALLIAGAGSRLADKMFDAPPPAPRAGEEAPAQYSRTLVVTRDPRGHFKVDGSVDGRQMGFMVDTGASVVVLREREAARIGVRPIPRDYVAEVKTANGSVHAAPVTLRKIQIGTLALTDVSAMVLPDAALNENLLGLSFLSRLRRFEYANGRLVLEQ